MAPQHGGGHALNPSAPPAASASSYSYANGSASGGYDYTNGQLPPSPGLQILAETAREVGRGAGDHQHAPTAPASTGRAVVKATPIVAQSAPRPSAAVGATEAGAAPNSMAAGLPPPASDTATGVDDRGWPRTCAPPVGASPGFGNATVPFSPSMFCTLLSSPDLQQLMSPDMLNGLTQTPAGFTPAIRSAQSRTPAAAGALPAARGGQSSVAPPPNPTFSQFKRRQQAGLPSDMNV